MRGSAAGGSTGRTALRFNAIITLSALRAAIVVCLCSAFPCSSIRLSIVVRGSYPFPCIGLPGALGGVH